MQKTLLRHAWLAMIVIAVVGLHGLSGAAQSAKSAGMPVFQVDLLGALLGSILVGLIGGVASQFIRREDERE